MEHYMCIYNPKLSQYIKRQTAKKCATYNSASYQTMLFLNYTLNLPHPILLFQSNSRKQND